MTLIPYLYECMVVELGFGWKDDQILNVVINHIFALIQVSDYLYKSENIKLT